MSASTLKAVFTFTTWADLSLLAPGVLALLGTASVSSINSILYGKIVLQLSRYQMGDLDLSALMVKVSSLVVRLIILAAAKLVAHWIGVYFLLIYGEKIAKRVRYLLYGHLLRLGYAELDARSNFIGNLAQVHRCVEELREGVADSFGLIVEQLATVIALLITSFCISWSITLIALTSTPLIFASCWYFGAKIELNTIKENSLSALCSKILNWNFKFHQQVKFSNAKFHEMLIFNKAVNKTASAYFKLIFATLANAAILRMFGLLLFVQIFAFGNSMISRGHLQVNQVVTCISTCINLNMTIAELGHILASLNKCTAAVTSIKEFLLGREDDLDLTLISEPVSTSKIISVETKSLNYTYNSRSDSKIINNCSILVNNPTGIIFVLGKSGSGKSTLAQLLSGPLTPDDGSILVNGKSLSEYHEKWISNNIMYLPQFPVIFKDTIYMNVAVGLANEYDDILEIPSSLVHAAMDFAGIYENIIQALPNGENTIITSSNLSGGQKQRIALARAKLRNPSMLVLDEALSALDLDAKSGILKKVKNWRFGQTTFMITHDKFLLDDEDKYIIIEEGTNITRKLENFDQKDLNTRDIPFQLLPSKEFREDVDNEKLQCCSDKISINTLNDFMEGEEPSDHKILSSMSILQNLVPEIHSKLLVAAGIVLSLINSVTTPISSFIIAKLLSNMMLASKNKPNNSELIKYILFAVGLAIIESLTSFGSSFLLGFEGEKLIVRLRKQVFANLLEQALSYFDNDSTKPARLTTLIMNDTRDLRALLEQYAVTLFGLIILVLTGTIWSITTAPILALVGISFVPLIFLITSIFLTILADIETSYKDSVAESEVTVFETAENIKSIKAMCLQNHFKNKFDQHMLSFTRMGVIRGIAVGLSISLSEFCSSAAVATIFYYGIKVISNGKYTSDQFFLVVSLISFTLLNASSLLNKMPDIARGRRSGTYMIEMLQMQCLPLEISGGLKPLDRTKSDILCFENVTFSFPGTHGENVLRNTSFAILKGEKVVIQGKSGSGKSTISSLIERLYVADSGYIKLYGTDVRDLDIEWLRSKVAIVSQVPSFFEGSIIDNLIYGLNPSNVSNELVESSLRQVGIYDFVMSLQEGWHTVVGEGVQNSRISGGQLQRLSIARALIRQPELLIMDEPTSSLDSENAKFIIDLIHSIKTTLVVITHDKDVINSCNRVLTVENRTVKEKHTTVK